MRIIDPLIAPYEIKLEEDQFTVVKMIKIADKDSDNFGKMREQIIGYFSTLPGALDKITKMHFADIEGEITLKKYLEELKEYHKQVVGKLL